MGSCETPEGALVFVKPEQYQDVRRSLEMHQLHPFHIVISESLEYLLDEILTSISFKKRPRVKDGARGRSKVGIVETPPAGVIGVEHACNNIDAQAELLAELGLHVRRTFLNIVPILSNARSVVQSSTEAHGALNPRRMHANLP